jgi:hypothetical protein
MAVEEYVIRLLRKRESTFEQINLAMGVQPVETAALLQRMERKGLIVSIWKKQLIRGTTGAQSITRVYIANDNYLSCTNTLCSLWDSIVSIVQSGMLVPYDVLAQQVIRRR